MKNRESDRIDTPHCVDVAHAKTDACEDAMQALSSVSVAHSSNMVEIAAQECGASPPHKDPEARESMRTVYMTMQGDRAGNTQKSGVVEQLVAAVSRILVPKRFLTSTQQGIETHNTCNEAGRAGHSRLSFPCESSAMGFYLLFQDYQWESSDGGPGLIVELDNPELQRQIKALDSTVRYRLYDA